MAGSWLHQWPPATSAGKIFTARLRRISQGKPPGHNKPALFLPTRGQDPVGLDLQRARPQFVYRFEATGEARMLRTLLLGGAMLISFGLSAPPAQAGYVVTLQQVGSNVVATGMG